MDFFDDILGRIIPIIFIFVIFRNLLQVIFGRKRPMPEEEPSEYDENGNPMEEDADDGAVEYDGDGNPIESEDEDVEKEPEPELTQQEKDRAAVEKFERLLKQSKPPAPVPDAPELRSTLPPPKKEQKVIRDEDVKVIRDDKDKVIRDENIFVHRDDEPYHKGKGAVLRDKGEFEKDNSRIYREKPLIEEEISKPVVRTAERVVKRKKASHPEMVKAIRWMEILGKPKGM